jgi:hypothetical protein
MYVAFRGPLGPPGDARALLGSFRSYARLLLAPQPGTSFKVTKDLFCIYIRSLFFCRYTGRSASPEAMGNRKEGRICRNFVFARTNKRNHHHRPPPQRTSRAFRTAVSAPPRSLLLLPASVPHRGPAAALAERQLRRERRNHRSSAETMKGGASARCCGPSRTAAALSARSRAYSWSPPFFA